MKAVVFLASVALATPAVAGQQMAGMDMDHTAMLMDDAQGRGGGRGGPQTPPIDVPWNDAIPPGTNDHAARALQESSRHGEWVDIALGDGTALKSWVVYPERADRAGVVLVIHDIFGMRDLARALGDQLAQDGFIAIVPDFLSGKGPDGGGSDSLAGGVNQAIMSLSPDEMIARLNAAKAYGDQLPASNGTTGVIGFCWGGDRSFAYAAAQPDLDAAVVFYGAAPGSNTNAATADDVAASLADVQAPVLGLYAGNDARINATLPVTEAAMQQLGKRYEVHTFEGAGHGFVFSQAGAGGANLRATADAWPMVVGFFRAELQ